jgi:hypothetical protein
MMDISQKVAIGMSSARDFSTAILAEFPSASRDRLERFDDNSCTFVVSGFQPRAQPLYRCSTCVLTMCAACARACHNDHCIHPIDEVFML